MAKKPTPASEGLLARVKLAHRLTGLVTATSVVSILVPCVVIALLDGSVRQTNFVQSASVLVDGVAAINAAAVTFSDRQAAVESLATLAAVEGRVTRAALFLQSGEALATYGRTSGAALSLAEFQNPDRDTRANHLVQDDRLLVSSVVRVQGEDVGTLLVEFSRTSFNRQTAIMRSSLLAAVLLSAVIAWVVGWRLQRFISGPIGRLAAVTRVVSADPGSAIRAIRETDDEIGELVNGFNGMLDHIQARDADLAEQRRGLEAAVSARTSELVASADRFKRIVESTHAIPWEADATSLTVAYIAPQAFTLFGCDSAAFVGTRRLWDMVHERDRERVGAELAELGAQVDGSGRDIEFHVETPGRRSIDVRTVASVHESPAGDKVLRGIIVDVTDERRLERELQQAQKLESVGRLASGVAHEINTPVQFVSDSVHFVRDATTDIAKLVASYRDAIASVAAGGPPAQAAEAAAQAETDADLDYLLENMPAALDRALDGLSRVAVIVRSMKDFAHPDQTAMADVDLNRGIESTLVIANNEYKYVADVETSFGALPTVRCHAGEINQVVLNIVVNAAHAIGDQVRGTGEKGRIAIATFLDGDDAVVTITDTGGGIPESVQDRIFDPFFTTKEVGKGTGQGLAMARSIVVEKHDGRLDFETEAGVGTTFTIRLPIAGKSLALDGVAA